MRQVNVLVLLGISCAAFSAQAGSISLSAVAGTLTSATTVSCPGVATYTTGLNSSSCTDHVLAGASATFDPASLTVGVRAAASFSPTPATADSTFSEQLLVTGGSGTGYLTLKDSFTGYPANAISFTFLTARINSTVPGDLAFLPYSYVDGSAALVPIVFGTPFTLTVDLKAMGYSFTSGSLQVTPLNIFTTLPCAINLQGGTTNAPCDSAPTALAYTGGIIAADSPEPSTLMLFFSAGALIYYINRKRVFPKNTIRD
jgi:hypothetical protein